MRTLLVAVVAILASIATALAAVLAPNEIQSTFFTGQAFTASAPNIKYKMVFTADGKMTREPAGGAGSKSEGTWKLTKDGFCTTWKGSKANCYRIADRRRQQMVGDEKAPTTVATVDEMRRLRSGVSSDQIPDRRTLSRQRIGRIPGVLQRLEAHGADIEHDEPPGEAFAEADDLADHLEHHQRADHANEAPTGVPAPAPAEHRAGATTAPEARGAGSGSLGCSAPPPVRLVRADHRRRYRRRGRPPTVTASFLPVGSRHPTRGSASRNCRTVGDDVITTEMAITFTAQVGRVRLDLHMGIHAAERRRRALDLGHADGRHG